MFKSIVAIAGLSLLAGGGALAQSTVSNQNSAVHNNIPQPRIVAHVIPSTPIYQYTTPAPPAIVNRVPPFVPQPRTSSCPPGRSCAGNEAL
jgi:hypothetical protein